MKAEIGKLGLMWPSGLALKHQAAKLLQQYSELGCPVDCGPPWTSQHITAAVKRGPHISAKSPQAQACLLQEQEAMQNSSNGKT